MKMRFVTFGVWLVSALLLPGQTFQVIYHFTGSFSPYANGQLLLISNTLYGTTMGGGSFGYGTVFKINTNGKGYAIIKSFTATDAGSTNADGAEPMAGLVICSNRLFGTTYVGGSGGKGTVFGLDTNGSNFVVLNNFNGTNGKNPYVGLTVSSNILYGTTAAGGVSNKGAIFRVKPDGTGFSLVKSFYFTDGLLLLGGVAADGGMLYGTTYAGGISNHGTIYSIGTNGRDFSVLRCFSETDGTQPRYSLVLSGSTLYGVTEGGDVVYRINTDGTHFAVIKRFSESDDTDPTNADGSYIRGGLVLWDGVLYGTTSWGGLYGNGVIFKINPDGSGFAILKHFSPVTGTSNGSYLNSDGMYPLGDLMVADGILYGTTQDGGGYGCGTIYSLTIPSPPPLQITNVAGRPLIFWNDDGLNRALRMTSDLAAETWTNVILSNWTNSSSTPRQIGYQITDTPDSSGAFFRLQ